MVNALPRSAVFVGDARPAARAVVRHIRRSAQGIGKLGDVADVVVLVPGDAIVRVGDGCGCARIVRDFRRVVVAVGLRGHPAGRIIRLRHRSVAQRQRLLRQQSLVRAHSRVGVVGDGLQIVGCCRQQSAGIGKCQRPAGLICHGSQVSAGVGEGQGPPQPIGNPRRSIRSRGDSDRVAIAVLDLGEGPGGRECIDPQSARIHELESAGYGRELIPHIQRRLKLPGSGGARKCHHAAAEQ